jgi:hypothetical protein
MKENNTIGVMLLSSCRNMSPATACGTGSDMYIHGTVQRAVGHHELDLT